jgi:hypothetical protein
VILYYSLDINKRENLTMKGEKNGRKEGS